ncbi:hypothetical protein, partial [Nevskia soli]|uniref:hypothetical protein n=1 Tax=Nevskia soli TaxID=418856 RepID=UPI0015D73381
NRRALAAAGKQADAAPVAWMLKWPGGISEVFVEERTAVDAGAIYRTKPIPLYAAQPAAPEALPVKADSDVSGAQVPPPLNGIPATYEHDEGAMARCSYCDRYSLDPKTLRDDELKCDCGRKHGWSGSFKKPGPDAEWSGTSPSDSPGAPAKPADATKPPKVTAAMVDAAMPWLKNLQHMRKTDKESNIEEAIRAAMAAAQPANGGDRG